MKRVVTFILSIMVCHFLYSEDVNHDLAGWKEEISQLIENPQTRIRYNKKINDRDNQATIIVDDVPYASGDKVYISTMIILQTRELTYSILCYRLSENEETILADDLIILRINRMTFTESRERIPFSFIFYNESIVDNHLMLRMMENGAVEFEYREDKVTVLEDVTVFSNNRIELQIDDLEATLLDIKNILLALMNS